MLKNTKFPSPSIEEKLEQALIGPGYEPYKLPENWCWVYLGSINKYVGHSINPISEPDKTFELYSVPSIQENYPEVIKGSEIGSAKQSVEKGDVLLCKINPRINRVWMVTKHTEHTLTASSEWIVIRNNAVLPQYMMWCMRTPYFREYMLSNVSGIGGSLMRAKPEQVKKYPIALAPLPEQHHIVKCIESLFSKLDEAKEKVQEAIDSFETRKAAILHKAFSGELTAKWREKNGVGINSWDREIISKCCKIGSGGTPSRKNSAFYSGDIPWIKTGEIDWNIVNNSEEKITQEAIDNSSAKLYDPGAVLVAMYGMGITRGRAAILGVRAATNQAVCVLQPKEHVYNRFLFYFFMCNYWKVREQAVGGNQLNLSATIIGKLNIDIPTIGEQKEIVRLLDSMISKEQQFKQTSETIIDQINTMKKAILARAFRGELGTNNMSEENAIELLKRILSGE